MFEKIKMVLSFRTVFTVVLIVAAICFYIVLRRWRENYKKSHKDSGLKATGIRIAFSIAQFAELLLFLLLILYINGVNITGIFAGLGIVSAIVGLALQDYLKDIIMGIHILSDHFYTVGECVEYDGAEGVIVGMTLKTTKIGNLDDHSIITVCNRNISQIRRLANRMDIDIPLSYNEDVFFVDETLTAICKKICGLESVSDCKYEGTQSFESSAILYKIRVFCKPEQRADVRRAALKVIQIGLRDAGIGIPFNQLDVHCDISGTEK